LPTSTRWRPAASRTPNQFHTRPRRRRPDRERCTSPATSGFVVVHRCGEAFYFLLVCIWRAVVGKRLNADGPVFLDDDHRGTLRDRVEDLAREAEDGSVVFRSV
jgi:hypothetical protein